MSIDDINGDGKYTVNDFLDMNNNDILKENGGKKFDVVLMNPPYDKNIHLKFLEKVINIANNIISIQPVRWLKDPFAMYKRSTLKKYENVAKNINSIEEFKNKNYDKDRKFDIQIFSELGIYVIQNNNNKIDYKNYWKENRNKEEISIIEKVCFSDKCKYLNNVIEKNKRDGIRVPIALISGNRGTLPIYKDISYTIDGFINGKDWTKCKNMGGYEKPENSPLPNSIKFKTEEEARNFYNSYKNLIFLKMLCDITNQQQHIQDDRLPFLNDYSKEITDKYLYNLFELTENEIKYIENYKKTSLY